MKLFKLASILSLAAVALAEDVITLTTSNFEQALADNPFLLVEFYAPWCGHCKKLAPEYEKAATAAKSFDTKVVLAKVDATEENELSTKFGVKGFPTLKWFVNGEVSDYTGGRDEATIVSWLRKKTGPPAKTITTAAELETFKTQADAVAFGVFKDEAESKSFINLAQVDDETPYGICVGDCAALNVCESKTSCAVVFKTFDEKKALFDGDLSSKDEIELFVSANIVPLVIKFSQKVAPKIFGGKIKTHLLVFLEDEESAAAQEISDKLSVVAKEKKGEMLFVLVGQKDKRIVEFFGVKEGDLPAVRIVQMSETGARKFKFTGPEISSAAIKSFVDEFQAGKVPMDLKSADIVPESEQKAVRVLVGHDFEKIVSDESKDVLVEFYAPWCGHCKKLEPEYDALGEHFKDNDKIVIAKVDATENEVERVAVSGFPTLKFFPAGSQEIVDYNGARDKDGMVKFLEENAVNLK